MGPIGSKQILQLNYLGRLGIYQRSILAYGELAHFVRSWDELLNQKISDERFRCFFCCFVDGLISGSVL